MVAPAGCLCDVHRWTMGSSSKDTVRVMSNHLVLSGVPDHITSTTKVLGDNTWEVSVTSPQKVPVIHRLSLLEITTNCLLVMSCFNIDYTGVLHVGRFGWVFLCYVISLIFKRNVSFFENSS